MDTDCKILLIEPSVIVREGIVSIIESIETKAELVFINSLDELFSLENPEQYRIVLVNPGNLNLTKKTQNKLINTFNKQNLIGIVLNHFERGLYDNFSDTIFINDKRETIEKIISKHLVEESRNSYEKDSTLSERETDVLKLLAEGKSNKEIAEELFISVHTVVSHRKNISSKLGVKSTAALVIYAVANGIIDVNDYSE